MSILKALTWRRDPITPTRTWVPEILTERAHGKTDSIPRPAIRIPDKTEQQPILLTQSAVCPSFLASPPLPLKDPSSSSSVPDTHTERNRAEEEKRDHDHGLHLVRRPGALRLPLPPLRLPRVRDVTSPHPLFFFFHAFLAHHPTDPVSS